MGMLRAMVAHPEEVYPMVKLKLASDRIRRQIPAEPHWAFSYSMLQKVSRSFALVIQQLGPQLRDAVCVFYLVLRALDTVGGAKDYKILMDKFHLVSTAFLELDKSYQVAIEDITRRMGAGMAKFICKEVESIDDYDEYCHYVAGLVGLGLSKLFHASGSEELASDNLSNSMGLFLQKTNIIRDYLEDINEIPKSRMFWPRQIWSKYADKLEDFKNPENSTKAVECLNDLVTNSLIHAEDCLQYMSALKDLAIFRFCAIPQIMAIGTLALCYNNVEVFRGVVKMRRGLTAKIIDQTNSMSDVYGAFYEFSSLIKSKIDGNDPNANLTRKHVEAIQKACGSSGLLNTRGLHMHKSNRHTTLLIMVVFLLLAMVKMRQYLDAKASHCRGAHLNTYLKLISLHAPSSSCNSKHPSALILKTPFVDFFRQKRNQIMMI
ncbi:squalene [Musa troglodytarum]|uniref:Squalene synthase n=1 Tax=Musa troglodytarum TaxID=320322 RepID=A0A9E7JLE6_9LILI|nr:squalene [Musa troglodytarum]